MTYPAANQNTPPYRSDRGRIAGLIVVFVGSAAFWGTISAFAWRHFG